MDHPNAKVAERLRKCLQSITTPVRIRTLASHFQEKLISAQISVIQS